MKQHPLQTQLKRLRLRRGDVIVTRNRGDFDKIMSLARDGRLKDLPPCEVILVEGSIHRLSKDYLLKLALEK